MLIFHCCGALDTQHIHRIHLFTFTKCQIHIVFVPIEHMPGYEIVRYRPHMIIVVEMIRHIAIHRAKLLQRLQKVNGQQAINILGTGHKCMLPSDNLKIGCQLATAFILFHVDFTA